ncbi:MAG: DUF5985 family protein [Gammaproteobacteria bacterium]
METNLVSLAGGALIFGYLIAGLFFLRFWRRTRDGLFAWFAIAFWLMAVNQLALAFLAFPEEEMHYIYLIRISAFILILWAVIWKNLRNLG